MPQSKQADNALWPIDNERKEIRDVTTQHTHVKGLHFCDRGKLAPKHHLAIVCTGQPKPGFDDDRTHHCPHPTRPVFSDDGLETECLEDIWTEYGAVGAGIQQQRRLNPRAIMRLNLRAYHGAYE